MATNLRNSTGAAAASLEFPVDRIDDADRVRRDYGDIEELAQSMSQLGLIQPIVINHEHKLVVGGRRLRAARHLKWTTIPVVYIETLSESHLRILEAEENVRRKDFHWTEKVLAIDLVHREKSQFSALNSIRWTQAQTGALLNRSQTDVSYATLLAGLIRAGDKEIEEADSMIDAIRILLKRREEEVNRQLVKQTIGKTPDILKENLGSKKLTELDLDESEFLTVPGKSNQPFAANIPSVLPQDNEMPGGVAAEREAPVVPISQMLRRGDCIEISYTLEAESVDHIITDIPYAIEMSNLSQDGGGMVNIEEVIDEHDVTENQAFYLKLMPAMYRILKENGYFIFWYDLSNHERLYNLAKNTGFRVQSWPLVWYKTHVCKNQSAQYNFTKNFEVAMVCRKGNATLLQPQGSSVWMGSNEDIKQVLGGHPFVKPFKLWQWLYGAVALRGSTVFDPCAGVGSSTIAAINYGLRPIACELQENHYNRLVTNITNHYKQLDPSVKFI